MKNLKTISDKIKEEAAKANLSLLSYEIEDEDPSYVIIIFNTNDEWVDENGNDDEEAEKKAIDKLKAILNKINFNKVKDDYEDRYIDYKVSSVQYDGDTYSIYIDEK